MGKTHAFLLRMAEKTLLFTIVAFIAYAGWCVYRDPTIDGIAKQITQFVIGILMVIPSPSSLLMLASAAAGTAGVVWVAGKIGAGGLSSAWMRALWACVFFAGVCLQREYGNVPGGARLFLMGALCFIAASTKAHQEATETKENPAVKP